MDRRRLAGFLLKSAASRETTIYTLGSRLLASSALCVSSSERRSDARERHAHDPETLLKAQQYRLHRNALRAFSSSSSPSDTNEDTSSPSLDSTTSLRFEEKVDSSTPLFSDKLSANRYLPHDEAAAVAPVVRVPDPQTLERALSPTSDREWDTLLQRHMTDSSLEDPVETYEIGYVSSTAAPPLPWDESRWKITTTASLLQTATGDWTPEQWFAAEDLLVNWWSKEPCVRAIILQFALYRRSWEEKTHYLDRRHHCPDTNGTETNAADLLHHLQQPDPLVSYAKTDKWLNAKLLNHMVYNWATVYTAHAAALIECHLGPTNLLETVWEVYNGHFGAAVSDKTLYFILEADVNQLRRKETPELAERIIDHAVVLWESGHEGSLPKTTLFNQALKAWVKAEEGVATLEAVDKLLARMMELNVPYSKNTYTMALQACVQQGTEAAARRAEDFLQNMYSEYLQGSVRLQPDVYAFTSVVHAWAKSKSPQAGPRAEQIYQQMLLLRKKGHLFGYKTADTTLINCALLCWGNSGTADAATKAEEFWLSTRVAPCSHTYTTLISLYSQHRNTAAVQRLWHEMETALDVEGKIIKPEAPVYTAILSAYAKSKLPNKLELAEAALKQMKEATNVALNTTTYNGTFVRLWCRLRVLVFTGQMDGFVSSWANFLFFGGFDNPGSILVCPCKRSRKGVHIESGGNSA